MNDPHTTNGSTDAGAKGYESSAPPATPRWVKAAAAVIGLFVVVVLAKVLFGGGLGGHGPGMHSGLEGRGPALVTAAAALPVTAFAHLR